MRNLKGKCRYQFGQRGFSLLEVLMGIAPPARRPDLVELPRKNPHFVSQPFCFSGVLHQQGLPNHALPELLLESVGADQVKVRFAKVNLNDVVARVVSVRHRVLSNAFGCEPTL